MDATELTRLLSEALRDYPEIKWGSCPMPANMGYPYKSAISIAVPMNEMTSLENYTEPSFRANQFSSFAKRGPITKAVTDVLDRENVKWMIPMGTDKAEVFETEMKADISAKEVARRSGIGWIGKSNLLITREYGPRLMLMAILADNELVYGEPMDKSLCGGCTRCTDNCALNAIKGVLWEPGMDRDMQVDYKKCSFGRLEGYEKIGRKYNCGMCIAACPYGSKKEA